VSGLGADAAPLSGTVVAADEPDAVSVPTPLVDVTVKV
jgi:hypothetical protein